MQSTSRRAYAWVRGSTRGILVSDRESEPGTDDGVGGPRARRMTCHRLEKGLSFERLASQLRPLTVPAGAVVIRQGDHGDLFYLVESGRLRVTVDGARGRELGPGDSFGEIALLRDVPRTATVTATSPTRLYALEREHFLDAVNGSPSSREAADALIDMRLGSLQTFSRPSRLRSRARVGVSRKPGSSSLSGAG